MKKIRFLLSLYISKIIAGIVKIFLKDRGTNFPGQVALKLCPDFLRYFKLPSNIVAVTGSNGKTSTTNFINDILVEEKYKVISNKEGSNMATGIATALIKYSDINGKCSADIAVFEVDERGSSQIYQYIIPTYLVCTNLFRDSIMRNGHSEFIKSKIEEKLPKETLLILNADDLISGSIGNENNKVYYAVDAINESEKNNQKNSLAMDVSVCPKCMGKLEFDYLHYHHIGKTHCIDCDFKSEEPDIIAKNVDLQNGKFFLEESGKEYEYSIKVSELFNVYNIVAAITLLRQLGITHEVLRDKVSNLNVKLSRKDEAIVGDKKIIKMLSKDQNPISCSRAMDYLSQSREDKAVILEIMNFKGREDECEDVSWIYDTDFEYLADDTIKQIIIGGKRAYDITLRLLLAGVKKDIIDIDLDCNNILNILDSYKINEVYILHSLYAAGAAEKLKQDLIKKMG
jgi:UDP-N-acetylmuramyl tripeptide synthase